MKTLRLIIGLLFAVSTSATAQTYQQRGVVRMITTSAQSPITPVAGVKVAVGNSVSKPTGSNGAFTMQVTKQFQVNGVSPSDTYVLALPTKGKTYYQSQNDLDVVVITKAQKEADYKRLYNQIKAKYDAQSDELMALKRKYQRKLNELQESDAEYSSTKARLDSLQALYLDYINNEQKIDEEIKRIAEDLTITDYLALDSLERRVYELKCAGEWKSISDLMHKVMHGDAAAYLKEGLDNKSKAEAIRKAAEEQETAAERDLATRFRFMEETIESFKMQHLNDSVSKYYKILTDAAPDNWNYLNEAGTFENRYIANYSKALDYHQRAIATNPIDTLLATSYNNMGTVYYSSGNYAQALEFYEKALKIRLSVYGENHPAVATSYNNIGGVYYSQGNYNQALKYYEKVLEILLLVFGEDHQHTMDVREAITVCSYMLVVKNHDKELYKKLIVKGTIVEGGEASLRGLSGDFFILSFGDWTIETYDKSIHDVNDELRGKSKDVVFYKDGKIIKEHFENMIGMQLDIAEIEPSEKAKIVEEYNKWKKEHGE